MSCWLKQSTAVDIAIGPFLNSADGNTVEGALTITQPDIRLKKNGGAWAQKNAAQTLSHEEAGWYEVSLDATDTDTLGILIVAIHESGALPVWREFLVVPANVYDSFFSTDFLQVDVAHWLNATAPAAPATQTSVDTLDDFVDTEIANIQARLPAALVSGRMDSSVGAVAANAITDASVASDMDSYAAKVWIIRQSTTKDEYGVTFFKNGQPIETGITSPLIDYVKKLSDGTILVNDATLTDQSNGDYYYGETTNKLVGGTAYMMRVTAVIDGSTRIFKQQIGRDSV